MYNFFKYYNYIIIFDETKNNGNFNIKQVTSSERRLIVIGNSKLYTASDVCIENVGSLSSSLPSPLLLLVGWCANTFTYDGSLMVFTLISYLKLALNFLYYKSEKWNLKVEFTQYVIYIKLNFYYTIVIYS